MAPDPFTAASPHWIEAHRSGLRVNTGERPPFEVMHGHAKRSHQRGVLLWLGLAAVIAIFAASFLRNGIVDHVEYVVSAEASR